VDVCCVLCFLSVVNALSYVRPYFLDFHGVVFWQGGTFSPNWTTVVMGSWECLWQEGKAKPGSRQITLEGCIEPLLQMCVAPESAFPTRVFSLSGKTHTLLCLRKRVLEKHFRKHSNLSRFLGNVAVITFNFRIHVS
jgi:hypothetical protein